MSSAISESDDPSMQIEVDETTNPSTPPRLSHPPKRRKLNIPDRDLELMKNVLSLIVNAKADDEVLSALSSILFHVKDVLDKHETKRPCATIIEFQANVKEKGEKEFVQWLRDIIKRNSWEDLLENDVFFAQDRAHSIDDVLAITSQMLNSIQTKLKDRAQSNHQDVDHAEVQSKHFLLFMGGIGKMYNTDSQLRERVDGLFAKSGENIQKLLFNTSGSGKTQLLIEGLCQNWGFYFTCKENNSNARDVETIGSDDVQRSWGILSSSFDFEKGIDKINTPERRAAKQAQNAAIAERIFQCLLLARGLVFEAFLRCANLTNTSEPELRRRWTHLQLVPFDHDGESKLDIFTAVFSIIVKCQDLDTIVREKQSMLERIHKIYPVDLWVVLDEAQIASDKLFGSFYTENKSKQDERGHGRSVLREMVAAFALRHVAPRLIISGTGLSLDSASRDSSSAVGKNHGDFAVWSDTGGFDTQESQSAYLLKKLPSLSQEVLDRAWHWLRGRYRFTTLFTVLVLKFGQDRAQYLLNGLIRHLTSGYEAADFPATAQTLTDNETQVIKKLGVIDLRRLSNNSILENELAQACLEFFTKGGTYISSSQNARVVQIGFARLEKKHIDIHDLWLLGTILDQQNRLKVVVNEPLAALAALQYFGNHDTLSIDKLIERNLRCNSHPSVRGYLMEPVTMMSLTRAFNGVRSLSEIFDIRGDENVDYLRQPATLQIITGRKPHGAFRTTSARFDSGCVPLLGLAIKDPENVSEWLNGSKVIFLFPPTNMGPDLIFLTKAGCELVWVFIQVRSRAKKLTPKETTSALQTVKPEYLWMNKNGPYSPASRPNLPQETLKQMRINRIPVLMVLVSHPSEADSPTLDLLGEGVDEPKFVATFDVSMDPKFSEVLSQIEAVEYQGQARV